MNRIARTAAEILAAGAIGTGVGIANYEFTEHVTVPAIAAAHKQKYEYGSEEWIIRDASILGGIVVGGLCYAVIDRLRRRNSAGPEEEPEDS